MKKIFLTLLLLCSNAYADLTDIKFGQSQIADSQWNVNACLNTTTCQIYSKNPGTAYKIPWTSGQVSWASGDYVQFSTNGNASFPYTATQYTSAGIVKATLGNGKIVNMGPDYFFFVGSDNNTGQLFSGSSGMNNTTGVSWTGTLNPTVAQANTYANANYSTVPLTAGQTATTTPSSPPPVTYTTTTKVFGNRTLSYTVASTPVTVPSGYISVVPYTGGGGWQNKTYTYTATATGSGYLMFAFRHDPNYWVLDNVSIKANNTGANLLVNGGLDKVGLMTTNVGGQQRTVAAPTAWGLAYQNNANPTLGGGFDSGMWYDTSVGSYGAIYQNVNFTAGTTYTITFMVASDYNSNGSTIQMALYAGSCDGSSTNCTLPTSTGMTSAVTPSQTYTVGCTTDCPVNPSPPAPVAPTNYGFESGNTTSWTISNTTGAANWNSGSGVAVVTGLQHTPGDGKTWTVNPYGTYMLSLQPGSGAPTFDSATTSLGLTPAQNTAIKNLLIQQAQTSGGDPTPTNAAWVKRDMTLRAGVTYSIAWQYLSTDYTPFNDGSMITLVHKTDGTKVPTLNNAVRNYALLGFTNPGTGDYSTSSYGATGWQVATFTVPTDGDYSLGFAVFNLGDTALSPILLIDEMQGTTMLNGSAFNPVPPNPGSGAPVAGGGGAVEPTWPETSDITAGQTAQRNAAKARVASITLGNHLYIEQKIGSSGNTVTVEQTGNYNKIAGPGGGTYSIIDGDNNVINIKQGDTIGKNLIEFSIVGNTNTVSIWQARNPTTGLQDGQESGGHYIGLNVNGSTNTLSLKQSNEGGTTSGHFAYVDISGNNNQGTLKQMGNGEKTFFGVVNGSTNIFDITQQGTGSYFDLSLTGNGHSVTANQKDAGSHKATVNLTNSGGASTVTLIQQGSTAQNINITQQCATLSGCSVSVTQGQ